MSHLFIIQCDHDGCTHGAQGRTRAQAVSWATEAGWDWVEGDDGRGLHLCPDHAAWRRERSHVATQMRWVLAHLRNCDDPELLARIESELEHHT